MTMKFDVTVMNPPYDKGLGDKFLIKMTQISNSIVSIQPLAGILYRRKNKNLMKELKNYAVDIEKINDSEKVFDAGIGQILGFYHITKTNSPHCRLNGIDIDNLDDIRWYSDDKYMVELDNIVKELYENDNFTNHIDNIKEKPDPEEKYAVKIAGIRGHKGADDFLSIISNNEKFNKQKMYGEYENLKEDKHFFFYISFENEQEMQNFLNYVKTDFARSCLSLNKTNLHLYVDTVPWFDFSNDVFNNSPKEIDDYLFDKYKISKETRKHIEEIIPDYYKIRKSK